MKRLFPSGLHVWLDDIPIQDPVERRIASLLQFILLGLIMVVLLATLVLVAFPIHSLSGKIAMVKDNFLGFLVIVLPLLLLRRGYFRGSLLIIISILIITPTLAIIIAFDLLRNNGILFQYTLAVIAAGLLMSRGILALTFGISVVAVGFSAFLGSRTAPQLLVDNVIMAVNFILFNGLIALFIDQVGITLRTALREALEREDELQSEVAERKQAEELIKWSEERYRVLVEQAGDGIFITNSTGKYVEVNQAGCAMLGYSLEELQGKTINDLISEADKAKVPPRLDELRTGRTIISERQLIRNDGSLLPVEITARMLSDGRMLGIARDITKRKQAEEVLQKAHDELEIQVQERTAALSQANSLLQTLLDTVPDHIFFKDLQSRFIRNSRSQATMLGLQDPAEAVGKTDFDFFPHAQQAYKDEQEIIKSGQPWIDFEEFVVWPNGAETWVSTTKVPLRDQAGQIIGTFGIARDITDRKRVDEELRKAKAELEVTVAERTAELQKTNAQLLRELSERKRVEAEREKLIEELTAKNAELERFTYTVSHDMKSPLVTIRGFLGYLEEDAIQGNLARLKSDSQRIANAVDKMSQLLDDLLELSRVGRFVNPPRSVPFEELATQAIELVQGRILKHGIVIDLKPNLPIVYVDKSRLIEALQNLLDNAAKYIGDPLEPRIEIGWQGEDDDEHLFYIRDNGIGIEPEYCERIFGLFNKLDARSEGTGVGLALVKRIIEFHGGRIWVESTVGVGSTFWFTLPSQPKPDSVI